MGSYSLIAIHKVRNEVWTVMKSESVSPLKGYVEHSIPDADIFYAIINNNAPGSAVLAVAYPHPPAPPVPKFRWIGPV